MFCFLDTCSEKSSFSQELHPGIKKSEMCQNCYWESQGLGLWYQGYGENQKPDSLWTGVSLLITPSGSSQRDWK